MKSNNYDDDEPNGPVLGGWEVQESWDEAERNWKEAKGAVLGITILLCAIVLLCAIGLFVGSILVYFFWLQ